MGSSWLVFEAATGRLHSADPRTLAGPAVISDITLVLGGARSGKSRYAEQILQRHQAPWVYIATAQALGDEMRSRIAEHRFRRGPEWHTVEAPVALADALDRAGELPVLVDCLTLWLTNVMLGGHDVPTAAGALAAALQRRTAPTLLVSNEVGLGIVPHTRLGRSFRDQAGWLNQRVASLANQVVFMIAGLPMTLK
jgi:adenosylcobinamide kinase/adenosylcobinamide-phosphate guanylyltransferase